MEINFGEFMLDLNNNAALIEFLLKDSKEVDFEYINNQTIRVFDGKEEYGFQNNPLIGLNLGEKSPIKASIALNGQYTDLDGLLYVIDSCLVIFIGVKLDPLNENCCSIICLLSWR